MYIVIVMLKKCPTIVFFCAYWPIGGSGSWYYVLVDYKGVRVEIVPSVLHVLYHYAA